MYADYTIEELRALITRFNSCREDFNMRWSVHELLQLNRMWLASDWDILPDQWTELQLWDALRGIVPTWRGDETPVAYDCR